MQLKSISVMLMLVMLIVGLSQFRLGDRVEARQAPTATPAQVDLNEIAPTQESFQDLVDTPTRTPTPLGIAQIEANEGANVRAEPAPDAELLGQIRPGEYYNVIRRYYRWIEIQYDASPTRRGWVFDELVTIIGEESVIPVVESLDQANTAADDFDSTATGLAITQTPGSLLTATAAARVGGRSAPIQNEFSIQQVTQPGDEIREALPTYTYPPGIIALAPTEDGVTPTATDEMSRLTFSAPDQVSPIVPVAALGALGLLGLLASSIRRGG
jgi:hypothetical protein